VLAAQWPPADDNPASSGGGLTGGIPGGGGFDGDGGDFKKGGKAKLAAIAALVVALGAGAVFALSGGEKAEVLTVDQAAEQMKNIFVLPKSEQVEQWRAWAAKPGDDGGISEIKQEALKQLAWARDEQGVALAIAALKSPEPKLQSMAATALTHYGSPAADAAKPALLEALKTAGGGSKPQIAWALVVLGEQAAFDDIMSLYRQGHLATVQRLGGGVAFDPNKLTQLVPLEKLAELSGDESPAVRQLIATVLSRHAEPKWTETLIKLLNDPDHEVARQAAPGLGKIGDKAARDPLITKLKDADKDSREKYLQALRDGVGGIGLVVALYAVDESEPQTNWYRKKQIFGLIDELNDPRAADSLYEYLQVEKHIHYQTRAASALAAIGDVRAVPMLAKRLRMDPLKIYSDQYDWEMALKRDDAERREAARMIADLAVLHPDKRQQIAEQAEDAVIFWIHEMPSPHANGLRALAAMGSTKDIEALRKWANPQVPLPKEGQQPPMPEEWVVAQSALRYVGMMKDDRSWGVLLDMLKKKPANLSISNDAMYQGGLAILGMSLNAVGKGASDGLSEWGDTKAFGPLLEYIEDTSQNENARESACAALAWVATPENFLTIAEKIQKYEGQAQPDAFRRKCLLEALIQRPVPGTAGALIALLNRDQALETRNQVARAIAKSGIDAATEAKLFELAKDENLLNDAALALILGGSPDAAARAVAFYADKPAVALEELQDLWFKSFGYWSTEDLSTGVLFKYVDNAVAISRVEIRQTPQEWAPVLLGKQFDNLIFDNGPHSFTRVVLRKRLYEMARGNDAEKRAGAIRTLLFMKEQGTLLALRDEEGETGKLAADAYFTLMNPKVVSGVKVPESEGK
jgi:HEAT repeat protein